MGGISTENGKGTFNSRFIPRAGRDGCGTFSMIIPILDTLGFEDYRVPGSAASLLLSERQWPHARRRTASLPASQRTRGSEIYLWVIVNKTSDFQTQRYFAPDLY